MYKIHNADARHLPIADNTIQCAVTSPPYYGLRDYGVDGQIGLESTPDEYVANLVSVFREVRRVLKDDGTLWLNLGDSYNSSPSNQQTGIDRERFDDVFRAQGRKKREIPGMKPKDLIGIPWMVAFALRADGWYLRSDIIWAKPNPMPESVKDRPTKSHEYLFLLTKSDKYYYDAEAILEPAVTNDTSSPRGSKGNSNPNAGRRQPAEFHPEVYGVDDIRGARRGRLRPECSVYGGVAGMRNRRSVWTINTQPFKGAHFATMPEKLVEPCILAGSRPGDTILDPFSGAGTVGVVAQKLGRDYIGIELNPQYVKMSEKRLLGTPVGLYASD